MLHLSLHFSVPFCHVWPLGYSFDEAHNYAHRMAQEFSWLHWHMQLLFAQRLLLFPTPGMGTFQGFLRLGWSANDRPVDDWPCPPPDCVLLPTISMVLSGSSSYSDLNIVQKSESSLELHPTTCTFPFFSRPARATLWPFTFSCLIIPMNW